MSEELNAIFKYTSAKDGKGVEELFEAIIDRLLQEEIGPRESARKERLSKSGVRKKGCC